MTVGRCLCIKRKQSETALNMSAPSACHLREKCVLTRDNYKPGNPQTTLLYCAEVCVRVAVVTRMVILLLSVWGLLA